MRRDARALQNIFFKEKTQKFKKDIGTLRAAADGEIFLDVKNPKLFKKVRRFYERDGAVFSGEALDDYEMLMELSKKSRPQQKPEMLLEQLIKDRYNTIK